VDSEDIVEEGEQKSETDGINSDQSTEELQQMAESTYLLRKVFKSYWCTLMNILYIYIEVEDTNTQEAKAELTKERETCPFNDLRLLSR
jgi:hypothetical protein